MITMPMEFSAINELAQLRKEKDDIMVRESELSAPLLTDFELIPKLYEYYKEIQSNRLNSAEPGSRRYNRVFIFIIIYLYSPAALAGGKVTRGVRDVIAGVLGFKSPTAISNISADMMLQFNNYKDFRKEVEVVFRRISEWLHKGYL